jgi:hypothetical protein
MRINAEKERINIYKTIISKEGQIYYSVIQYIFDANLEISRYTYFILDFIKTVIESGEPFHQEKFLFLIRELDSDYTTSAIME